MPLLLTSIRLTLAQLFDAAFLRLVLFSLLASALVFAGLFALAVFLSTHFIADTGWLAWLAGSLGGLLALGLAVWFFVPISIVIIWMFTDSVSNAVERRFYPDLPPPTGIGLREQAASALALTGRMLMLYTVALPALFIPGLGMVVFGAIGIYQLSRELFEAAAQRRTRSQELPGHWRRARFSAWGAGGLATLMSLIPGLNLLMPVLGTAIMTHIALRSRGAETAAADNRHPE